jgi:pimeloyl-ACP methyl ester carboxylesterase
MDIDLELYRREVHISPHPLVRLSVIDISPDRPQRTLVFLHGFGGRATHWMYQLQKFSLENRIIARKAEMWYPTKPGKPAFPRDVEEVLYEVPQVKEAAVVAIDGQPIAFVIA